jgi:hypothetical protein
MIIEKLGEHKRALLTPQQLRQHQCCHAATAIAAVAAVAIAAANEQ